jgi:hypothetical protein
MDTDIWNSGNQAQAAASGLFLLSGFPHSKSGNVESWKGRKQTGRFVDPG